MLVLTCVWFSVSLDKGFLEEQLRKVKEKGGKLGLQYILFDGWLWMTPELEPCKAAKMARVALQQVRERRCVLC